MKHGKQPPDNCGFCYGSLERDGPLVHAAVRLQAEVCRAIVQAPRARVYPNVTPDPTLQTPRPHDHARLRRWKDLTDKLTLARGVVRDDTEERLRATRELAFYCAGGCKAIVPVNWEDIVPGDIVCTRCSWVIATFHPRSGVKP